MNGPVAVLRDGTRIDLHERSELIGRINAYVCGEEMKNVGYASEIDGVVMFLAEGKKGPVLDREKEEFVEATVTGPVEIRIDGVPAYQWVMRDDFDWQIRDARGKHGLSGSALGWAEFNAIAGRYFRDLVGRRRMARVGQ